MLKKWFNLTDAQSVLVKKRAVSGVLSFFRYFFLLALSYVVLFQLIYMITYAIRPTADEYNPSIGWVPSQLTFQNFAVAIEALEYGKSALNSVWIMLVAAGIEVLSCSVVAYGFARFEFPLKKLLFGCIVVMIVVPNHTIMLPQYMTFRSMELMRDSTPMYILSIFGVGLRSGLYVYIFNQFFRGLPKEIEEAAFVDGAGTWYTYFRIMLVNAMPAVITVTVFSLVWQYNDMFYAKLFQIPNAQLLSRQLSTLQSNIGANLKIMNVRIQKLYVNAGVVLVMLPILLIYLLLQKRFVEGVERSGIVG